jgi:uncharacterized protein YegL
MFAENPLEGIGTPTKPGLVIFFVIDRSLSMHGARINSVNNAMRETIPILKGVGGSDADLKIAVLTFSGGAEWMYSQPVDVNEFTWNELGVESYTSFASACNELCAKMSRNAFMGSKAGYKKPVVILITDGEPTDEEKEWRAALAKLKANRWFQFSIKVALAVDEADEDVLAEFVGSREGVFKIENTEMLKKLIKIVAVTSSEIGSKSMPIDVNIAAENRDDEAEKQAHQAIHTAIVEDDDGWV